MKVDLFTRHSFVVLLVAVFFMPFAFSGARRALLSNRNDVKQWLPDRYEATQVYNWFQKHFEGEEFVLVSWEGCTLDDQRLKLFCDKLDPKNAALFPERDSYFSAIISGNSIIERLTTAPLNLTRDEAIERLRGSLIGPNLQQTCAVLTLSPEGKQNLRKTVERVYDVACGECGIGRDEIHLGGPPVDNVSIDLAGEKSLVRLALLSGAIGLTVSWWALRSGRLIAMVMFTGLYTIGLSMAVVYYTGTPMNAILLSMPSLVYVTATSGAIHLANYYRDTVNEHGVKGAAAHAIGHAILPLGLATVTTAFGLVSLCTSELVPIQLFGIYSAVGVVVSLLLLFFFLPACLETWPIKPKAVPAHQPSADHQPPSRASLWWWHAGQWVVQHYRLVSVGCIGFMVLCLLGTPRLQTSVQMMRFFNGDAPILRDYRWLEEHLGELVPVEIVIRTEIDDPKLTFLDTLELVERVQHRINEIPDVGSSLSTATFAPSLHRKTAMGGIPFGRNTQARVERSVRNKRLLKYEEDFLAGDYLRKENGHYLWRISARVAALRNVDYAHFNQVLREYVEPVVDQQRQQGAKEIDVVYTGLVPIVYQAQESLLEGLALGFVSDLVLIIIVMMVAVRSFSAGLLLSITSVFPAAIIFGMMGWMGIVVDVGTVMTPAVALGVTVDDVVHFMLWYKRGVAAGGDRQSAVMLAYKGCARAMYQSWGVIGLGLSVFAFSPFTPTQRFGYLMLTLLTAALPGNLLLLPALLAGPLGKLFARGIKPDNPTQAPPGNQPHSQPAHRPMETPHRRRRGSEPIAQWAEFSVAGLVARFGNYLSRVISRLL